MQVRAFKRELAPSDAGDVDILLPEVFTFSLMDTVSNMWRAGVYALSALILIFSVNMALRETVRNVVSVGDAVGDFGESSTTSRTRRRRRKMVSD